MIKYQIVWEIAIKPPPHTIKDPTPTLDHQPRVMNLEEDVNVYYTASAPNLIDNKLEKLAHKINEVVQKL